ncbi:MAG: Gfo/Idh/MocA family protein [Lachnospiraceae bacterium]
MIRVGIIGCGSTIGIAKEHIRAYKRLPQVEITAMYDLLPKRAENYIKEFELEDCCKACSSLEELLSLVDAVSICTPNSTHTELSVSCLKAGKHVLCEKPFAPTEEECKEAIRYAKLTGKVAMMGLCYRDIPGFVYMKKLIDDGVIGKVFFVREEQGGDRIANPDVKLEWRMDMDLSGPGAMADFGSHMMDICDYLLRDQCGPIREITCKLSTCIPEREIIGQPQKMGPVTNDDVGMWIARTENGTLESFTASRVGAIFQLEIIGEGGKILFDGSHPFQLTLQLKDKDSGYTQPPKTVDCPPECFGADPNHPNIPFQINFYYEIKQFIDAIETGTDSQLTFNRGLYIQKLIDACQTSADLGETVYLDFQD